MRSIFPLYLAGLGSWFVPLGIQMVLFPWLVAVVLHMDAFAVGVAQTAIMAPSLLFLPLGGLAADRGNPRRLLLRYQCSTPCRRWCWRVIWCSGGLSYPLLIAYGLAAGSIGAFAIPTRDALLPVVAKGNLPRAVALATALQFGGQLIGIACASIGRPLRRRCRCSACMPAWCCWARSPCAGCPIRRRIRRPCIPASGAASPTASRRRPESDQIWPVLLINFGVGVFYVGPFMAVLPIVVRDHYHGGAAELAYVNLAFWAAHHRRGHGLRGPRAASHAARPPDRRARSRSAAAC